jgi:hypothetical protein
VQFKKFEYFFKLDNLRIQKMCDSTHITTLNFLPFLKPRHPGNTQGHLMKFGYIAPNNPLICAIISLSEFSFCPTPFYHLKVSLRFSRKSKLPAVTKIHLCGVTPKDLSKYVIEINLAKKLGTLGRFF